MEVALSQVQSRFNFTDPNELAKELEENQNGSYFQKLDEFVDSEKQRLRERYMYFIPILHEDPEAYDQVWEASSEQIKRSLELFWFHRFEWDDIEREARELEAMKAKLEQKFCDFKREMDCLLETTLYRSSLILINEKIMEMHRLLREMVLKIYPLFRRDFGTVTGQFEAFKCSASMSLSHMHDERITQRITGELRWNILRRQIDFIADNFAEGHKASVRLVRDILPMGNFISRWNKWLVEEAMKLLKPVVNPVLRQKQGQEVFDLLNQTWIEMICSLTLPLEYVLVFQHPNTGKVPIDMLC